jgi:hypothetical protein
MEAEASCGLSAALFICESDKRICPLMLRITFLSIDEKRLSDKAVRTSLLGGVRPLRKQSASVVLPEKFFSSSDKSVVIVCNESHCFLVVTTTRQTEARGSGCCAKKKEMGGKREGALRCGCHFCARRPGSVVSSRRVRSHGDVSQQIVSGNELSLQ